MKHVLIILMLFLLVGCSPKVTPVKRSFPPAPPSLQQECPNLKLIPEETNKLSEVLSVISTNYGTYHECKIKVESWIEWYKKQKQIFESVK